MPRAGMPRVSNQVDGSFKGRSGNGSPSPLKFIAKQRESGNETVLSVCPECEDKLVVRLSVLQTIAGR
jgi:hypothetical protein